MITTLGKAIKRFGFEDPRTITIAFLEETGKAELAEELYATLVGDEEEEEEDDEPLYYNDDWDDDVDESGFDPYEGCYTFDC